ncbi:hypothetical protein [Motiliproteus sp. MSK22-1]|uniref:hypothetical protein n=1 Tax=Motiliproteus sp. MSK22-1 TaxID=1897630 RepID=UPI0013017AD6|nr:hypothetical protein [Motiliproteus sp. MSK22-1]
MEITSELVAVIESTVANPGYFPRNFGSGQSKLSIVTDDKTANFPVVRELFL